MMIAAPNPPTKPNIGIIIIETQSVLFNCPWKKNIKMTIAVPAPALTPKIPGSANPFLVIP